MVALTAISFVLMEFFGWSLKIDNLLVKENHQQNVKKGMQRRLTQLKEILYMKNEVCIKELINNDDSNLHHVLRMINFVGPEKEYLAKRRETNKHFIKCLTEVKMGGPQAFVWLKKHVDYETCEIMISDLNYTGNLFQVMADELSAFRDTIKNAFKMKCNSVLLTFMTFIYKTLKTFGIVAAIYIDLTFDSILLYNIMVVLGATVFEEYMLFSSQITVLLLASIIVPNVASAISITCKRPTVVLDSEEWMKWRRLPDDIGRLHMFVLRFLSSISFLFMPAMIVISNERAKEKRKALIQNIDESIISNSSLEELELLTKYINESRLALLTFKRYELSIELVIQLSIHLIMVLLSQTKFPIESSLQAIFQSNEDEEHSKTTLTLLVLSLLWSFKTAALTCVKIKTESKKFLPLFPKLILGLKYYLVFVARIDCIAIFYSTSIGLLGIMDHHHAETIPLNFETWLSFNDTLYQYWNLIENEFQSTNISQLFRSDYTDAEYPQPPSITNYTLIGLGTSFKIFWVMYAAYAVLLAILKYFISEDFRAAPLEEKVQHILEALNIPEAFGDWDTDNEIDVNGHRMKWQKILIEMLIMVLLQFITNMALLVPFFITGTIDRFL